MADDSIIRISTVYDVGPIIAGNQQAAASTEQMGVRVEAALARAKKAHADYEAAVAAAAAAAQKVQAAQVGVTGAEDATAQAETQHAAAVKAAEVASATSALSGGAVSSAPAIQAEAEAYQTLLDRLVAVKAAQTDLVAAQEASAAASARVAETVQLEAAAKDRAAAAAAAYNEAQAAELEMKYAALAAEQQTASATEQTAAAKTAAATETAEAEVVTAASANAASAAIAGQGAAAGEAATATTSAISKIKSQIAQAKQSWEQLRSEVKLAAASLREAESTLVPRSGVVPQANAAILLEYKAALESAEAAEAAMKEQVVALTAALKAQEKAALDAGRASTLGASEAISTMRVLEGSTMGAARAAGQFLTATLGLGPVFQAVFPVIGVIAILELFRQIPEEIAKMEDALAGWNKEREKTFKGAIHDAETLIGLYERFEKTEAIQTVPPLLVGPAKTEAEVRALGEYQNKLKETEDQLNRFKAALDAAKEGRTTPSPTAGLPGGSPAPLKQPGFEMGGAQGDKVRKDLEDGVDTTYAMLKEYAEKHNQPIPVLTDIQLNLKTSPEKAVSQLDELLALTHKKLNDLAKTQEEVRLERTGKTGEADAAKTKEEWAAEQASLENTRHTAESRIALKEAENKHLREVGQITADREIAENAKLNDQKIAADIKFNQDSIALQSRRDVAEGKNPEQDTSIIRDAGNVEALRNEQHAKDIAATDAESKAKLRIQLEAIDEQVAAIKAVPTASVAAEAQAASKIADLQRQGLLLTVEGTEERKAELRKFEEASRAVGEAVKKADQETTKQQMDSLRSVIKLADEAAEHRAKAAVGKAEDEAKSQKSDVALEQTQRIQPQGGVLGAVYDLSHTQSDAARQAQIVEEETQKEIAAYQALYSKKIAGAQQVQQQLLADLDAGRISEHQYTEDAQRNAAEITKNVQDNAAKQAELKRKLAAEEESIANQSAQRQMQLQKQISDSMAREASRMIFQSRNLHDAVTHLWQSMVQGVIQQILKMAAEYITQHFIMAALNKIFHFQTTSDAIAAGEAENAAVAVTNDAQITSYAGVAAAAAYAAYAAVPPVAAGMAAEAAATVESFTAMGSAEHGWDLPAGGPFPAVLHAKEMVLPSHLAEGVRSMSSRNEGAGGSKSESTDNSTTVNINNPRFIHSPVVKENTSMAQQGDAFFEHVLGKFRRMGVLQS